MSAHFTWVHIHGKKGKKSEQCVLIVRISRFRKSHRIATTHYQDSPSVEQNRTFRVSRVSAPWWKIKTPGAT
ncbi:hypothetical protein FJTKL_12080 [Diaporthe vaccinii]|uniref:Uncharacterized protein n=1 Tax=Diaporthe vaccinii TaxID=105482 RepID=A0ABR4FB47_9PEZI